MINDPFAKFEKFKKEPSNNTSIKDPLSQPASENNSFSQFDKFKQGYSMPEPVDNSKSNQEGEGSIIGDIGKKLASGATKGLGMAFRGGGEILAGGINATLGTDLRAVDPLEGVTEYIEDSVSQDTKDAVSRSEITGDILNPSSYDFGEDPSLRGIGMQAANALGQIIPQAGIALATGGASVPAQAAVGAGYGLAQGVGAGAEEQGAYVDSQSHSQLYDNSGFYRDLVDKGVSPKEAKNRTKRQAEVGGSIGMGLVTSIEQGAENVLINAITKGKLKLGKGGRLSNAIKGTLGAGVAGGTEEVIEGAAARKGSNITTEGNQDLTEDTLGDFVMGAIAEGTVGGAVSAAGETKANGKTKKTSAGIIDPSTQEPANSNPAEQVEAEPDAEEAIEKPAIEQVEPTKQKANVVTGSSKDAKKADPLVKENQKHWPEDRIANLWDGLQKGLTKENTDTFKSAFPEWYKKNVTDKKQEQQKAGAAPKSAVQKQQAKYKSVQSQKTIKELANEQQAQAETTQESKTETTGAQEPAITPEPINDVGANAQANEQSTTQNDGEVSKQDAAQVSRQDGDNNTVSGETALNTENTANTPEETAQEKTITPAPIAESGLENKGAETAVNEEVSSSSNGLIELTDGQKKAGDTVSDKESTFKPTHELPNGTLVIASQEEENVWIDRKGDEYEDDYATEIKQEPLKKQQASKKGEVKSDATNNIDSIKARIKKLKSLKKNNTSDGQMVQKWDKEEKRLLSELDKEQSNDNREQLALRRSIDEMSPSEKDKAIKELRKQNNTIQKKLYTSPLTKLPNKVAYDDAPKKKYTASIDVDSLKWFNDNLGGHSAGDALLKTVAKALEDAGIESYHLSGDEFAAQSDDIKKLESDLSKALSSLNDINLEFTLPNGDKATANKAGFSYSVGENYEKADAGLQASKIEREKSGNRAKRGQEPQGISWLNAKSGEVNGTSKTDKSRGDDKLPKGVIGLNKDGKHLREDKNGVRQIDEGGILVSETVSLAITAQGVEARKKARKDDFLTLDELKAKELNKLNEGKPDEALEKPEKTTNNEVSAENNQPGVSNSKRGVSDRAGAKGDTKSLPRGRDNDEGVVRAKREGDELPENSELAGQPTDGEGGRVDGRNINADRNVSADIGATDDGANGRELKNYDLRGKEPISLTPAKRRDINRIAEELLKKPVNEITEADKEILRQYTGVGGLDLETSKDKGAGIFNQHYTSYQTIEAMYNALDDAGLIKGKALEPSVGSGNFIGMMPELDWSAVDIDKTNTEVVARLYPDVKLSNESYETFKGKNFDIIISNVPFASFSSLARKHATTIKPAFKAIHNFFFAQSVDKLKDGGVMAFMTSTGTMDGITEAKRLRNRLIEDMDVIGAYRLPMGTQKANASTEVMIDVIFLQKRPKGVESKQVAKNQSFVDVANKDGHRINKYFIDYPESVLGELRVGANKTAMGREGLIVEGDPDYSKMKLEPQTYEAKTKSNKHSFKGREQAIEYAKENDLKMSYRTEPFYDDGVFYGEQITFSEEEGGALFGRVLTGENQEKMNALIRMEQSHDPAQVALYKAKYKKHPQKDNLLKRWAKQHRATARLNELSALFDTDFKPSEIFNEKVRFEDSGKIEVDENSPLIDRVESLEDVNGFVNTSSIDLVSKEEIDSLLEKGDYARTGANKLQNARLYYSGNIYEKLDNLNRVKPAAQREKQRAELERVLPKPIPMRDISIKGNEEWLPESAIATLGKDENHDGGVTIGGNALTDNAALSLYNRYINGLPLVTRDQKETQEEHNEKLKIAQRSLNTDILPQIKNYLEDAGMTQELEDSYNRQRNFFTPPVFDGSSIRDVPEVFRGKPFKLMKHQQEGAERAIYNKRGVIAFAPGLGKTPTAIIVIRQLLNKGVVKKPLFIVPANTIPQWEETARELYPDSKIFQFPKYQTGINKGKVKDWAAMNAADKEKMVHDLTNSRFDYTFISTNMAQNITVPTHKLNEYIDDLVKEMGDMEKPDSELSKQQIKAKETRLAKMEMLKSTLREAYSDSSKSGFDMRKLGFDSIVADEVQYYKNIGMQSAETRGGIGANVSINEKWPKDDKGRDIKTGDPLAVSLQSSRSYDFRFKTRYVSEMNNGNNIFLLTGTPTPNKPMELMTLLQHLDTKILEEYGIKSAEGFVNEFFNISEVETTGADGKAKMSPELTSIKNIQGLKTIITRYIDYRSPESAKDLKRPKQVDIQHQIDMNDVSARQFSDIEKRLLKAIEDAKKKRQGEKVDDMEAIIAMYGAGRDASIDQRLYKPSANSEEFSKGDVFEREDRADYSKIAKTVELVAKQVKADPDAGQLIFLDRLKFPNSNESTHADIRDRVLESSSLKPEQVVFVNGGAHVNPSTGKVVRSGPKPERLQQIINDYNSGKIKVLIGNTSKLGVGVDLQVNTTDIYQIDLPYRPDEIEQRNNRGVRQGNRYSEVRVHSFSQPGTFDAMSERIIANKKGFNDVFWTDQDSSTAEIATQSAPDAYEAAIEIEQDPAKKRKLEIERDLSRADQVEKELRNKISGYAKRIKAADKRQAEYEAAISRIDSGVTPNYEGLNSVEKNKKIRAFKKRMVQQRAKHVSNLDDIKKKKVEFDGEKSKLEDNLKSHLENIKDIRSKYVKDGEVTLFSKNSAGSIAGELNEKLAIKKIKSDSRLSKALDAGLLKVVNSEADIPTGAELLMTAWHGSPYEFNKFEMSNKGAGAGASAYGYGLYFGGRRSVAEWYKTTLAQKRNTKKSGADNGHLYKVELAPKETDYLLWDKPLSEQPDNISGPIIEALGPSNSDLGELTGEQAYLRIAFNGETLATSQGEKAASEQLSRLGIRGIKYLEGTNTGTSSLDYNYVIFSSDDIDITAKYAKEKNTVQGAYLNGVAYVVASGNTDNTVMATAWHELTHAMMNSNDFMSSQQRAKLLKRLSNIRKISAKSKFWTDVNARIEKAGTAEEHILDEIAGYAVTEYVNGNENLPAGIKKWAKDFIAALKALLFKHTGIQIGKLTASEIKAMTEAYVSMATKGAAFDQINKDKPDLLFSRQVDDGKTTMPDFISNSDLPKSAAATFSELWGKTKQHAFGALTLGQIGDAVSKVLPMVNAEYIPLYRRMNVARNKWKERGGDIAKERRKLGSDVSNKLSEVQHDATIFGVDPSKSKYEPIIDREEAKSRLKSIRELKRTNTGDGRAVQKWQEEEKQIRADLNSEALAKPRYEKLRRDYLALPKEAQVIYEKELEYHIDHYKARHDLVVNRLLESGLSKSATRETMDGLKEKYEQTIKRGPYFPLSRFGDYWLQSVSSDGESYFDMFTSEYERKQHIKRIKEDGFKVTGKGKTIENIKEIEGVSSTFLLEVDELMKSQGNSDVINNMRDDLYQLYLESLPDNSSQKHFMHRSKRKGFNEDQMKAFSNKVVHDANSIARLEFSHQMQDVLDKAEDAVRAAASSSKKADAEEQLEWLQEFTDNQIYNLNKSDFNKELERLDNDSDEFKKWRQYREWANRMSEDQAEKALVRQQSVVDSMESIYEADGNTFATNALMELRSSHKDMMNPNTSVIASTLNTLGFAWFLGATPAAAIVNLTQTPMVALPVMGAKLGWKLASNEMGQATKDYFSGGERTVKNALKNDNEREAYQRWHDEGLLDETISHDLSGYADAGIDSGAFKHKAMGAISYMFHHAEVANREITALSSYRAAIKKGQTHQEAMKTAEDITWKSHLDYGSGNRARFMRGNWARVLTQFKAYSQGMTHLYADGFIKAFGKNSTEIEKKEAKKMLTGLLVSQFAVTGALGMPAAGVAFGIAQAVADAFGDEDDPREIEAELRQFVTDNTSKNISQLIFKGVPDTFTPFSIHGRLSLSDLWIRTSDRDLKGSSHEYDIMKALLGPQASIWMSPIKAMDLFSEGHDQKAVEAMLPKAIRDVIKGANYGMNDYKTRSGYDIKEANIGEVLGQMVGFSSSEMSDIWDEQNATRNIDARLNDRRKRLIDELAQAKSGSDRLEARQAINAWNKKHPRARIMGSSIRASNAGKERRARDLNNGMYRSKRNRETWGGFDF